MTDLHPLLGEANVLFLTFDCLRHDVAVRAAEAGLLPFLPRPWEKRETPGTFTLPAHLAFFHGFLPTPLGPGPHPRLFALRFDGSLSTTSETLVFDGVPDIVAGFAAAGYRTFCVGGVGFFNKLNPLGLVLPGFFQESAWSPALGVAAPDSTESQVATALDWLATVPGQERFFLFVNVSATHP
ncbi:MAG: hypothetical protein K2W96_28700, partial [Gemmataceae bacterium]|nr:hypothetical protein [Gemmataceae bacterium]